MNIVEITLKRHVHQSKVELPRTSIPHMTYIYKYVVYRSCAKHITVFSNQLKTNFLVVILIQTQSTVQYKASLQSAFDNKQRLRRQN